MKKNLDRKSRVRLPLTEILMRLLCLKVQDKNSKGSRKLIMSVIVTRTTLMKTMNNVDFDDDHRHIDEDGERG
jgi:hypothetical protein